MKCLFSQQIASHTSYLHSFPTRRSSDLKVSAFAERHGLAHDANVVPGVQLEVLGFEHLGVAEMDIHLAGSRLQGEVRAHRRNGRSRFKLHDCADKRDFAIGIVSLEQLGVRMYGLLRHDGKVKRQGTCEHESYT